MLCSVCPCGAQNRSVLSRREMDSLVNPRAIKQSVMLFEQQELRIAELSEEDDPVTLTFRFSNASDLPIVITRVVTTCGCVVADYDRNPILAKGSGSIRVTFKPKGHPGALFRKVFVYTNLSAQSPTAQLALTGDVRPSSDPWGGYPHELGALRVRQTSVVFRNVPRAGKQVECIECVNSSDQPLRLFAKAAVLPPYLSFRTYPETIESGRTADLIFSVDTSKIPENAPSELTIPCVLEGFGNATSQQLVHVTILR